MPTPLLQYDMQETSGSVLTESISGNHGIYGHFDGVDNTVKGGDSIRASDPNAVSVQLGNPSKNLLTLPDTLGVGGVVSLSVEMLVRFDDISGTSNETLINLYGAFLKFSFNQNDKSFRPSIATHTIVHSVPDIANGDIHHIVLVFDHNPPRLHLYIDGGLAASSISGAVVDFVDGQPSTNIATNVVGSGNWATTVNSKSYSHLRIYDAALTAQEVTDLYDASINAPTTPISFVDYVTSLNPTAHIRVGETAAEILGNEVANDSSGNNNHGTYLGSAFSLEQPSLLISDTDTSVNLDGNAYIRVNATMPNVVAVHCLVKIDALSSSYGLITRGADSDNNELLYYDAAVQKFSMFKELTNNISTNVKSDVTVQSGQIYQLIMQYDGVNTVLYVDGLMQSQVATESLFTQDTLDWHIGAIRGSIGFNSKLDGGIDEILFFDTVLTQEQILKLYALARIDSANYLSYNDLISASNTITHYRLGETSGTVATDETGNHHGTYQNTPTLGLPSLVASDPLDKAVRFDGDARVYNNSLDQSFWNTEGSLAMVFKVDAFTDAWGRILSIGLKDINQMIGLSRNNTTNSLIVSAFGGTNLIIPIDLVLGDAYHITITKSVGTVTVYLNGTQVAQTTSWSGTISTNQIYIGGVVNSSTESLDGTIGDFALFDTALTEEQIQLLYVASKIDLTSLLSAPSASPDLSLDVTIVENLVVENWRGVAHLLDGTLVKIFDMMVGDNNLTFDSQPTEPIALTVLPNYGTQWASSTAYVLDDVVYPIDALTVPFYLKCTVAGTSGVSEPTWGQGSGQVDGTVTWDFVELIPNAISKYPITV